MMHGTTSINIVKCRNAGTHLLVVPALLASRLYMVLAAV